MTAGYIHKSRRITFIGVVKVTLLAIHNYYWLDIDIQTLQGWDQCVMGEVIMRGGAGGEGA